MIKKINVVGIQLDNYTVREMIMNVERMLSDNIFECIQEVDMDTLSLASNDEQVKEMLDSLTYTIISDVGILRAAGVETMQRKHEIEEHDFFYELFKRLDRNHKTVFVLGDSQAAVDEAEEFLKELFDQLEIVGKGVFDETNGTDEGVVNEINIATPEVVLSFLPSPVQEKFFFRNKDKISTILWYGIGSGKFLAKRTGIIGKIRKMLDVRRLTRIIDSYEKRDV